MPIFIGHLSLWIKLERVKLPPTLLIDLKLYKDIFWPSFIKRLVKLDFFDIEGQSLSLDPLLFVELGVQTQEAMLYDT